MNSDEALRSQQRENLGFLWNSINLIPAVQRTQALLEKLTDPECVHLFRYHDPEGVSGSEVRLRDDMDWTLGAYSLLTVAAIACYIEWPLPDAIAAAVSRLLEREGVRRYHELLYPIALPKLLLDAIGNRIKLPKENNPTSWAAFRWLVTFSSRFSDDRHLTSFLWLLDSGSFGEYDISNLLKDIETPKSTLAAVHQPDDRLSRPQSAILGCFRFLVLCRDLDLAFQEMNQAPLTRAAIWLNYVYWFNSFRSDVANNLEQCLFCLRGWLQEKDSPQWALEQSETTEQSVRQAITNLMAGHYVEPLLKSLEHDNQGWSRNELVAINPFRDMPAAVTKETAGEATPIRDTQGTIEI